MSQLLTASSLRFTAPRGFRALALLLVLLLAWGFGAVAVHSHPGHHSDLNCVVCRLIDHTQSTTPAPALETGYEPDSGSLAPLAGLPIPPESDRTPGYLLRAPPAF